MSDVLPKAFLDDIVANIDDDTPRLVYADWLAENGQDERAEFIRVQVERARLPAWDAAQVGLRLREQALLNRHGENWLAALPAVEGARWEGFRRGIVAEVSFASFEAMRASAHACRARATPRQPPGRRVARVVAHGAARWGRRCRPVGLIAATFHPPRRDRPRPVGRGPGSPGCLASSGSPEIAPDAS